jgi:hypothetical protein
VNGTDELLYDDIRQTAAQPYKVLPPVAPICLHERLAAIIHQNMAAHVAPRTSFNDCDQPDKGVIADGQRVVITVRRGDTRTRGEPGAKSLVVRIDELEHRFGRHRGANGPQQDNWIMHLATVRS